MPAKRKRSELKRSAAEPAKLNSKRHKTNNKTAPPTRQSIVDKEDPFDRLRDDIIVCHILSRLCLREAVRTSVLSRRWRNLWTASMGSKLMFAYPANHKFRKRCFIVGLYLAHGISRVLEHVKPTFDELTICYNFNSSTTPGLYQAIDRWVQIALANKVTRLHLDFSSFCSSNLILSNNYTFPAINAAHFGIHNLRDVCFKYINVSKEVIECMISNCPFLERLAVWGSSNRQKIRVYTQSPTLKSLEFVKCFYKSIRISSPNLIHLRYNDFLEPLRLEYAPLLSHLSIGSSRSSSFLTKGARFFRKYDISQLKRLQLDIDYERIKHNNIDDLLNFPKFINLEELEVELEPDSLWTPSHGLIWLIMLIKAAPSLQKFSVNLSDWGVAQKDLPCSDYDDTDYQKDLLKRRKLNVPNRLLKIIRRVRRPSLKLIEMVNFSGSSSEMKLGQHLLNTSPLLDKFVVRRLCDKGTRRNPRPRGVYRIQARKFNEWLPPNAKLVIL